MADYDVTVQTEWTPDLSFNLLSPGPSPSGGFDAASFLKPQITIQLPLIGAKTYAPYGPPNGSYFGLAVLSIVALFGVIAWLIFFRR